MGEAQLGTVSDPCHSYSIIVGAQNCDLSFSWYCRLPAAETVGAAVRKGETMLGLAAVASTRPAWTGTADATLLNMAEMCVCVVSRMWCYCNRLSAISCRSLKVGCRWSWCNVHRGYRTEKMSLIAPASLGDVIQALTQPHIIRRRNEPLTERRALSPESNFLSDEPRMSSHA